MSKCPSIHTKGTPRFMAFKAKGLCYIAVEYARPKTAAQSGTKEIISPTNTFPYELRARLGL